MEREEAQSESLRGITPCSKVCNVQDTPKIPPHAVQSQGTSVMLPDPGEIKEAQETLQELQDGFQEEKKIVLGKPLGKLLGYKGKSTVSPVSTTSISIGTRGLVLNSFPFPFVNRETGNQTFLWQWLLGGISVTSHSHPCA